MIQFFLTGMITGGSEAAYVPPDAGGKQSKISIGMSIGMCFALIVRGG